MNNVRRRFVIAHSSTGIYIIRHRVELYFGIICGGIIIGIIMFVTICNILEHIEEANFRGTTGRRYIETALVEVVL